MVRWLDQSRSNPKARVCVHLLARPAGLVIEFRARAHHPIIDRLQHIHRLISDSINSRGDAKGNGQLPRVESKGGVDLVTETDKVCMHERVYS